MHTPSRRSLVSVSETATPAVLRPEDGSDQGSSLTQTPVNRNGVDITAENSVFGLLHSWFLPAPPSNTGHAHQQRRGVDLLQLSCVMHAYM